MIVLLACICLISAFLSVALGVTLLRSKKRVRHTLWRVKIKFAHGVKVKLILNEEQHTQLLAWLNTAEGYFEIADETQGVRLYREFVATVELKRV